MDFGVVLHRKQQIVERVVRGALRKCGEGSFRRVHLFTSHGLAQDIAARMNLGKGCRFDRMQNLLFASAALLNAIRIPVKHLEDRQRLQFCGKLLGHVQRRRQGHHGVEADVILAAKSARVGQRRGGGQSSQIRA